MTDIIQMFEKGIVSPANENLSDRTPGTAVWNEQMQSR